MNYGNAAPRGAQTPPRPARAGAFRPPPRPAQDVELQTPPPAPQESDGAKTARNLIKTADDLIKLATQIDTDTRSHRDDHNAAVSREAFLNLLVLILEKLAHPLPEDISNNQLESFLKTKQTLASERDTMGILEEKLGNLYNLMPELISARQILRSIHNELEREINFEALTNLGGFGENLNQLDQLIENLATTLGYQEDPQKMRTLTIEKKFDLLYRIILSIKGSRSPQQQQLTL
jgi:chemotaxis protein histidine kinase CheA